MPSKRLSTRDAGVISRIKNPEASAASVLIDPSVASDPHIRDTTLYNQILEREIALTCTMEALLADKTRHDEEIRAWDAKVDKNDCDVYEEGRRRKIRNFRTKQTSSWLVCVMKLDKLIQDHPTYAPALNDRVQVLRIMYGDGMLVKLTASNNELPDGFKAVFDEWAAGDVRGVTEKVLDDLYRGIELLSPRTKFHAMSPKQAQTLSKLYLQRGRLYQVAAKKLARRGEILEKCSSTVGREYLEGQMIEAEVIAESYAESTWSKLDFERQASMDFLMSARYGSELGKGLSASTNPEAKLCGQIVAEAMKQETCVASVTEISC